MSDYTPHVNYFWCNSDLWDNLEDDYAQAVGLAAGLVDVGEATLDEVGRVVGGLLGLSTSHIFSQRTDILGASVDAWDGGSLIKVSRSREWLRYEKRGGAKRGIITDFTKGSRRRMLRTMGKIKRSELPMFVTLTYPGVWPKEPAVWKRHLKNFAARLRRRSKNVAFLWRMEFQKRGAPHYHLLVWGLPESWTKGQGLRDFRSWLAASWYEVVGSGDNRHLQAGTQCDKCQTIRGAFAYAAKYLGKVEEKVKPSGEYDWVLDKDSGEYVLMSKDNCDPELAVDKEHCEETEGFGRWWGIYFRASIPWGEHFRICINDREALDLIRRFCDIIGISRSNEYIGLSCFMDVSSFIAGKDKYL
jgi:hypothetical protein